jgi:hypothetical protein
MMRPEWHEEPVAKKHDRNGFDCGDSDLNEFLRNYAQQSHKRGAAKTFLAIDDSDGKTVYGYYSLSPRWWNMHVFQSVRVVALADMTSVPFASGGMQFAWTYRGKALGANFFWQQGVVACTWRRKSAARQC